MRKQRTMGLSSLITATVLAGCATSPQEKAMEQIERISPLQQTIKKCENEPEDGWVKSNNVQYLELIPYGKNKQGEELYIKIDNIKEAINYYNQTLPERMKSARNFFPPEGCIVR